MEEQELNLGQAIAASDTHLACRVVGDLRVIVDRRQVPLKIHIQRRSKTHWIIDDDGGGIRYLAGVLRDAAGSYSCASDDLTCVSQIQACLPPRYQALLLPDSNDWQAMESGQARKRYKN